MCWNSKFACIVTVISTFSKMFTFNEFFFNILFLQCNNFLHLDVILALLLVTILFFSFHSYSLLCNIKSFFLYDQIPNYWDEISSRNMLTYFCCWRIFRIVYASIYFFNQRFNVSVNNVQYFIWPHILIKFQRIILFEWHYNSTKIFILT